MALRVWLVSASLISVTATVAFAQPPTIVQPGAPGQSSKILSAATVRVPAREVTKADVDFMQGMIHHHSQAVEMTALMPARTHNKRAARIRQADQHLANRRNQIHEAVAGGSRQGRAHGRMQWADMTGMHMDHMKMDSMPMMPGMLTPEQMKALAKASGPNFDRLFLTGMIQHHTGALTMVTGSFQHAGGGPGRSTLSTSPPTSTTPRPRKSKSCRAC